MERTGTIPFMALQRLSGNHVIHMFQHDVEAFMWVFLWVCSCSDGLKREILVNPYKEWMGLEVLDCKNEKQDFLRWPVMMVSKHHMPNNLFCLFLAIFSPQLCAYIWGDIPTSADHNSQEQEDMARVQALLPKFREVRAELYRRFSPKDCFDDALRHPILRQIHHITDSIISQWAGFGDAP